MRVMDKFPIWSRLASVTDDHVRRLGKDWVFYCEKDSTGCVTLIIILELLQLFVCLFVLPSLEWPFWWIPSRENRAWKCTIELRPEGHAIITKSILVGDICYDKLRISLTANYRWDNRIDSCNPMQKTRDQRWLSSLLSVLIRLYCLDDSQNDVQQCNAIKTKFCFRLQLSTCAFGNYDYDFEDFLSHTLYYNS